MPRDLSLGRKIVFSLIPLLVTLVLVEAAAWSTLRLRYGRGTALTDEAHNEYDELLGWHPVRNYQSHKLFGFTINSQRFRSGTEFTRDIPPGRYRVMCLGDSFTLGTTDDAKTYPAQLEQLCPTIQTVNLGVGAYGVDQAYLRYTRDGTPFRANLVLFAAIEDDFRRMTGDTFMTERPKPQFVLENDVLRLRNVPVPTWGRPAPLSAWFTEFPRRTATYAISRRVYNDYLVDYDPYPVAGGIFRELAALSRERQQGLALVYLPVSRDLRDDAPPKAAVWMADFAHQQGIAFLDLTDMFRSLPPGEAKKAFGIDAHYNAHGNGLVASAILEFLRERFPDLPACSPTPTRAAATTTPETPESAPR